MAAWVEAVQQQLQALNEEKRTILQEVVQLSRQKLNEERRGVKRALKDQINHLEEEKAYVNKQREVLQQRLQSLGQERIVQDRIWERFWQGLKDAETKRIEGTKIFCLPSGACLPGKEDYPHRHFMVRKCYEDLAKMVQIELGTLGEFIIKGSPGIGKTYFTYYLMAKLAKAGKVVVIETKEKQGARVLCSDRGVFVGDEAAFAAELACPDTWYIVDGKKPKAVRAKTLLVTIEDHDTLKDAERWPCSMKCMPAWTDEEMASAQKFIYKMDDTAYRSRSQRWPGIPRWVFQSMGIYQQSELEETLCHCQMRTILNTVAGLATTDLLPALLVQITVPDQSENGYDEGPAILAPGHIEEALLERCIISTDDAITRLLKEEREDPRLRAFSEKVWIQMAHKQLKDGGVFDCWDLHRDAGCVVDLPECQGEAMRLESLEDLASIRKAGVYAVLPIKFGADAAVQPNYLYRVAVSGKEKLNMHELAAVLEKMARPKSAQLFLAVTPWEFCAFQSLKSQRQPSLAITVTQDLLRNCFLLKLELPTDD